MLNVKFECQNSIRVDRAMQFDGQNSIRVELVGTIFCSSLITSVPKLLAINFAVVLVWVADHGATHWTRRHPRQCRELPTYFAKHWTWIPQFASQGCFAH